MPYIHQMVCENYMMYWPALLLVGASPMQTDYLHLSHTLFPSD